MNYSAIKKNDIANGEGIRVSLFVSGCTHHCKGCFNECTWPFDSGEPFTEKTEQELLDALAPSWVDGLSLLGGEPFEPCNQRGLAPFLRKFHTRFPQKDIWAYTGYLYDKDLQPGGRAFCEVTQEILDGVAVLVDGPFILSQKDISLKFRGSANQRLIDLNATRRTGTLILLPEHKGL